MSTVTRICSKYPADIALFPDFDQLTVILNFDRIPETLQTRINDHLQSLGIIPEDIGDLEITLSPAEDEENCYLFRYDTTVYKLRPSHYGRAIFETYDMALCAAWLIYLLATGKEVLNAECNGKYVSCVCFSARQQASALRLKHSLTQQRQEISDEKVEKIISRLERFIQPFSEAAPRYSTQPINANKFKNYTKENVALGNTALELFGEVRFIEDLKLYCRWVMESKAYAEAKKDAVSYLKETIYDLPLRSVHLLFTHISDYIDSKPEPSLREAKNCLQNNAVVTLSATALNQHFGSVDTICQNYVKDILSSDFLHAVCDQIRTETNSELKSANIAIQHLVNSLKRFCFVDRDCFDQQNAPLLGWKRLIEIRDQDLTVQRDIRWTPESVNNLQTYFRNKDIPKRWILSERLYHQCQMQNINDLPLITPISDLGESCIWAIWAGDKVR